MAVGVVSVKHCDARTLGPHHSAVRTAGAFWDWIAGLDLNAVGFVIVGMFVAAWLGAMLVWRVGRIEERMSVHGER